MSAQKAAAYDIKNTTAGWFTASSRNTGVFYSSEENHELEQDKLEEKAGVQILVSVTKHIPDREFELWAASLATCGIPQGYHRPERIHLLQQILGLVGERRHCCCLQN